MQAYRLTNSPNIVIRTSDNANIPTDAGSIDYQAYLTWLAAGNTPLPYEPPVIDPKEQAKVDLAASDKDMARIAEDLINVLIAKGLMAIDDLPNPVIAKLNDRANLRKVLRADDD